MAKITFKKTYETIEHCYTILVDGKKLSNDNDLDSWINIGKRMSSNEYCCDVYLNYGHNGLYQISIPANEGDEKQILKMLRPIIRYSVENILKQLSE